MKRRLLIFGITALLLFSAVMAGVSMSEKDDKPPKVVPDTSTPEQVPPKSPDEPPVVTNVVVTPDKEGIPMPVFREAVIVYFKEMPISIDELASKYGVKLIFIKPEIKMAAFETRAIGETGKINQITLDFINEVSKDSLVERAFRDEFMFIRADRAYLPEPKITYPEDLEKQGVKREYILNKVLVGFWRFPPSLEDFASKHNGKLVDFDDANRALLYASFETNDVSGFIRSISTDPYVSSASPDANYYSLAYTPNDPSWNLQWGPRKIYAPEAWDYQKGSTSVVVAVLDTGVDYNHEDLSGRVIQGYDFVNNDTNPMDDHNHGTHVAGIAGAIMDNSRGIAGVAQVNMLAVKICDSSGFCNWDNITKGIYYAANNSAKVISMSIGRYDYSSEGEKASDYAYYTKGSLLVAASGNNDGELIRYPANFTSVIAVGATDSNDQRWSGSNYGAKLELVAPGVDVHSTIRNNQYTNYTGTSMATPHVSGVAALVWSQNPSLDNTKVREILRNTVVDLGTAGKDIYYGYGKVNAYAAVTKGKILSSPQSGTLSGTGASYTYSVSIPAPSIVAVVMAGNEIADFDLYAKWGSPPTTSSYDARGYTSYSMEYFPIQGSGTLYVMVRSYSGSGAWKSWVVGGLYTDSGRQTGTLSGTGASQTYSHNGNGIGYAFNSGPDGSDFDLYTKWNSPPTTSSYDASGTTGWAQEIAGPAIGNGTQYFMVRSYSGSGEYAALGMIY